MSKLATNQVPAMAPGARNAAAEQSVLFVCGILQGLVTVIWAAFEHPHRAGSANFAAATVAGVNPRFEHGFEELEELSLTGLFY